MDGDLASLMLESSTSDGLPTATMVGLSSFTSVVTSSVPAAYDLEAAWPSDSVDTWEMSTWLLVPGEEKGKAVAIGQVVVELSALRGVTGWMEGQGSALGAGAGSELTLGGRVRVDGREGSDPYLCLGGEPV